MSKSRVEDKFEANQLSLDYSPRIKSSFLSELAEYVHKTHGKDLKNLRVIFPNRRAGLYFMKELAEKAKSTMWAPDIYTLEEFYGRHSTLVPVDRYSLIFRLYHIYSGVYGSKETLDNFFFWGEMLLKDFDEVDKYLIDAESLFSSLTQLKSIESLEYLDEEQKLIIQKFWQTVEKSKSPESWVAFWNKLYMVYTGFRESLIQDGIGYPGLILRQSVESLSKDAIDQNPIIFAGFNALTTGEEQFVAHYLEGKSAEILWDYDDYYLNTKHEAGKFLRSYKADTLFNRSFDKISSDHLSSQKNIKVIGSGTWIGQVKLVGQLLEELSMQSAWEEESTVIVLPDEKLLLPLLNAIPASIDTINVTMGIMLRYTSAYSLLENIILLHKHSRMEEGVTKYFYKNISTVLRHPITQSLNELKVLNLERHINKEKKLYYSGEELVELGIKTTILFDSEESNLVRHLANIAFYLFENTSDRLQKIFLNALYHHLSRLSDTVTEYSITLNFDSLIRLFRQISSTGRIPFSGEPVKGLQIMGIFETRNLDFDNVFVLSLNEGTLPRGLISQSFIPFTLRRGFKMPTFEDSHSMQSYLFYRTLQRSKRVHLFYNSIGEVIGGEPSRYIQQLRYGFPVKPEFLQLAESYQADSDKEIKISKADHISKSLQRYTTGQSYLSPTALGSYLECSLKFYFKYILRLRKEKEVDEEINPMEYGNLLHNSAEFFYSKYSNLRIEAIDNIDDEIDIAIQKAFDTTIFDPDVGPGRIRRAALRKTLKRLVKLDSKLFPLKIVALEAELKQPIEISTDQGPVTVWIGGKIDRIDQLSDGTTRLIDYKTGKDEPSFKDLDALFVGESKGSFQLLVYSLIYQNSDYYSSEVIRPGLYAMRNLFKADFHSELVEGMRRGKSRIYDVRSRLDEFEGRLRDVLNQIFIMQHFEQTADQRKCEYCDFSTICRRDKWFKSK